MRLRLDQRGFTIIELLASMTLLMIFLALAFMAYSFGIQSFQRADQQSELQDQVRLASQIITDKLRYADEVTLLSACPITPTNGFEYICTSAAHDTIQHTFLSGTAYQTVPLLTTKPTRTMTYHMNFQQQDLNRLTYTITSDLDDQRFNVTSDITLLNMQLKNISMTTDGSTSFTAIAYKSAP
ncbi:PilW family protein [Paenibacillus sp. 1001270B_150601_E10]|uniref:PilW family protein n=1 Tax=Paenibacillus sp. 1001270B_150601_E10 TaxID=2787079 RepID=UPI001E3635F6|nr:prepilin-type N-terminal cleavage/methylation domain-containing protein [Paenibacillus sp. 1001270B_150601_E10]